MPLAWIEKRIGLKKAVDPKLIKEEWKKGILSKVDTLDAELDEDNLDEKVKDFFKLVHSYVAKLFDVNYECTYEEITSKFDGKDIGEKSKETLNKFLAEVNALEYDFPHFVASIRAQESNLREAFVQYANELEKNGRLKKEFKKELDEIVDEARVKTDREIVLDKMKEFKKIVAELGGNEET
ncbi:MAG: hypothetical protein NT130_02240 [Candidatus Micrarchaeota archaeon]|nr:hypothetical protein [Candidatus Micrarchaeota archaeon]